MCHPDAPASAGSVTVPRREVQVPVQDGQLPAMVAEPGSGSAPAVLIVPDIFGRSPFYEDLAARLAGAGIAALLPEIFFRQGPLSAARDMAQARERRTRLDENQTQNDLLDALRWLRAEYGKERVGTIGFCMGGTQVLDLAARDPDVVTVCFYGFPAPLPNAGPMTAPAPLDVVDDIRGPLLGFWGEEDTGVGLDNVRELERRLVDRGVSTEIHTYPGLGHGFMAASGLTEGNPGASESAEAWERTVAFLQQHL